MSVHYKFKSTLDFDTVSFDGLHISVADLKKAIFHQKRIGKNTDFDLQITNAQTKEDYTDDNALIAKNTSLIVARVPLTVQQKRTWDRTETPAFSNSKDESNLGRSVDLTRLDGSEEDKIRAMMTQSTQDYDPSNYMKIRGSNQTGEVPPNYRCYKCHQPGHWIKNCPLGVSQEPIEIKKSTGIPRSFMVPVDGPSVPGAMMTPGGTYAVPAIDHQAYKEGKKERPPFAQDPEPIIEKPEIPEDLLCNICKDLLTDAVMIPCCGNSFCDECIRTFLLESEEHECPDCSEKDVSPESLIPNRYLRNAVLNFKNETGYAKRPVYKPPPPQPPLSQKIAAAATAISSVIEPGSTISEKLSASPSMSAATPGAVRNSSQAVSGAELAEAKEADKPVLGKASPLYEKATLSSTALSETALETDTHSDIVTKLASADDEAEVPPPPGTEPPLLPKRTSDQSWRDRESSSEHRDDEYGRDRYTRERRRSFSRDNHRDRNASYHRVENNMRPPSRRRSLSPRNSQPHSDYPLPHQAGPLSKGYGPGHIPPADGRYHPAPLHYDPNLRRSTEDRAGTPTVDEPHLHGPSHGQPAALLPYPPGEERAPPPPPPNYNAPPTAGHNPPLLPDPYMAPPRMPMYPPHQQPAPYGPPPPAARYDGRPPPPPPAAYQQQPPGTGYRPGAPPRSYPGGPPRPMRGMHNRYRTQIRSKWDLQVGYRGMQPPPPGMGRNMHNGTPGVIDDPLEAFQRMLREKDERDRRMGKHRRRSRSPSYSRSRSRSRSRSFGRRASPSRPSRSRSPPPKRRQSSRSPPPSHRARSRTPKKQRRSRSGSFSISRSRSYSRSQSPRGSLPRERDRDRKVKRPRDAPAPYRSPARSPPRYHKDRDRERPRSREPYASYYGDTAVAPVHEPSYRGSDGRGPVASRYRGPGPIGSQQQSSVPPVSQTPNQPPVATVPPTSVSAVQPPGQLPADRKDYYDSYNRYPVAPPPLAAIAQPALPQARFPKPFDDVAPPGTEGYYDLPPPGVDHLERPAPLGKGRDASSKDKDADRTRDREDRDRRNDRDDWDRRDREERHTRDRRDDARKDVYDKETRYKDDRDGRHRSVDKGRRRDRDYERYERHHSGERKRGKRSTSPYKYRSDGKDLTPERSSSRKKDHHDDKSDDRKKEKKIKEKKKKKDSEEKEKKKKKKKEKKALIQKEKEAAAAAAAAAASVVSSTTLPPSMLVKVKQEPHSSDEPLVKPMIKPVVKTEEPAPPPSPPLPPPGVTVKTEPTEDSIKSPLMEAKPKIEPPSETEPDSQLPTIGEVTKTELLDMKPAAESLYAGLVDDSEISTTTAAVAGCAEETDDLAAAAATALEERETKEHLLNLIKQEEIPQPPDQDTKEAPTSTSPKKEEFLAPLPEPSKWEREEGADKLDEGSDGAEKDLAESEGNDKNKVVTTEVLKRAENAIFQKAINAIRPIEIKKISESRKVLYQNPEPKVLDPEIERESRKSVNVTLNVNKNERNVELSSEPLKKSKFERSKKSGQQSLSPTRLSAKERLGEKIEEEAKLAAASKSAGDQRRGDSSTGSGNGNNSKSAGDKTPRSRSPRPTSKTREKRISLSAELDTPIIPNPERKVFLEDRKRDRSRPGNETKRKRLIVTVSEVSGKEPMRIRDRSELRKTERITRTPPLSTFKARSKEEEEEKDDRKRDKKSRDDKKRKKEHRSRSKSRERKKRKDKKHKKDRERGSEKRQPKHGKDKEASTGKDKSGDEEKETTNTDSTVVAGSGENWKKQRRNPRLVSDRKRSILDEASFEPDYSASDSDSEDDDRSTLVATKRAKIDDNVINVDADPKAKKRPKPSSSEDDSSSSDSSSTDSDSSVESHRKKKKKHKKRKKRKARRDSSSDSDGYSDSSESSSEDEKPRKKKKSKNKSKQSKKKKKSKHK